MGFAAVVLAGGNAQRLDGHDKATIDVDGRALLEHVLAALDQADEIVVVGRPGLPTSRPVTHAREDPPGGGPVAGLVAGYAALAAPPDVLAIAAVDMPRLSTETFDRLIAALTPDVAGAFLTSDGRRHLAGVLRPTALTWPSATEAHGMPVHRLLAGVPLAQVPSIGQEARDVDTWRDLDELRGS